MPEHSHLLVPVTLQALVVNQSDQYNTTFSVSRRDFSAASRMEPDEPPPFLRGNDRPRIGVTLHWSLPDALAHGRRGAKDELLFPFIPNRWLVLRATRLTNGSETIQPLKAWIVESDFLGEGGMNLYPGPDGAGISRMGRAVVLADWIAAASPNTPFLTATGGIAFTTGSPTPGDDPAFAAYVGGIENVLSLYDDLSHLFDDKTGRDDPADLSYAVFGWYHEGQEDPMQRLARVGEPWDTAEKWFQLLDAYGWAVTAVGPTKGAPQGLPARTLCHGSVDQVNWNGRRKGAAQPFTRADGSAFAQSTIASRRGWRNPEAKGVDGRGWADNAGQGPADLPHIAIGNSAIDAMGALIANFQDDPKNDKYATLLQAIEYNLLDTYDQPGGKLELGDRIHQEWFIPAKGGTSWEIVEPRSAEDEANPDAVKPKPQPSAEMVSLLEVLNAKQLELDRALQGLATAQRELYEAWCISELLNPSRPSQASRPLDGALVTKRDDVDRLRDAAGTLRGVRDAVKGQVKNALDAAKAGFELRESSDARFYRPADPVVLVYGCKRSMTKHGQDTSFSSDEKLFCRVPDQTISSFTSGNQTISPETVTQHFGLEFLNDARLPAPVQRLGVEWVLLDPGWAFELGRVAGMLPDLIREAQAQLWSDFTAQAIPDAVMAAAAGFTGIRPSLIAAEIWAQPWSPVYLSWRVTWYPSAPASNSLEAMNSWTFRGFEHEWIGVGEFSSQGAVTVQGRTILSATSTRAISNALEDLAKVAKATGAKEVERMQTQLGSADLLSQTLTGFHDLLTLRDPRHRVPPPAGLEDSLSGIDFFAPVPFRNGAPHSHFYPLRAGHFRVERIWIVDAFGQVFDPIAERGQTPASFVPLRGSGLVTLGLSQRKDTQMLQLPPRLLQPARLQFRFERDDDLPVSALCGWLLPNHFDKSLGFYSADGEALGALLLSGGGDSLTLRWQEAVADTASVEQISQIPDPNLRKIAQGLAIQDHNADAFKDLIDVIDRTLFGIDPLGQRGNNLSVLIGRPIAVVRARVALELNGAPLLDPVPADPGQSRTRGLEDVPFPVALGHAELRDDGTLGYFVGDKYTEFQALRLFRPSHHYVVKAQPVSVRPTWDGDTATGKETFVTLLVDPRGSIHVRTGILPTKVARLPRELVEKPLQNMDVTFRVGPLLNEAEGLRMPIPAEIQGGWSWIQRSGISGFDEYPVVAATHHARMSDTPIHIREGWLRLTDAIARTEES